MKRLRKEKGITLATLVITIVLLLIIAAVTIKAIQGEGIVGHAKNAEAEWEESQIEYEYKMASNIYRYL